MPSGQTYWRYHNKPRSTRPRRVIARSPDHCTLAHIAKLMDQADQTAILSGSERPFFPFEPIDVVAIHRTHQGESGVWFRLHDGRVFRSTGELDTRNPDDYEP